MEAVWFLQAQKLLKIPAPVARLQNCTIVCSITACIDHEWLKERLRTSLPSYGFMHHNRLHAGPDKHPCSKHFLLTADAVCLPIIAPDAHTRL